MISGIYGDDTLASMIILTARMNIFVIYTKQKTTVVSMLKVISWKATEYVNIVKRLVW